MSVLGRGWRPLCIGAVAVGLLFGCQEATKPRKGAKAPAVVRRGVTRADVYLKRYKESPRKLIVANLAGDELKKVVAFLRKQHPVVSISKLLSYETRSREERMKVTGGGKKSPAFSDRDLSASIRTFALRKLHSSAVKGFVNSQGEGVGRLSTPIGVPDLYLSDKLVPLPKIAYSALQYGPKAELEDRYTELTMPGNDGFQRFFGDSRQRFLASYRWGVFVSEDEFAGFAGHGISKLPQLGRAEGPGPRKELYASFRVRQFQLVSLLKHDQPRVYESKFLPMMRELRTTPTRATNEFEKSALGKLVAGERLVFDVRLNRIRMVGAIRAVSACADCHQVEVGEMLGAFSYEFLRATPLD